ncbi:MAG: N-acetylneuraminate synthase [Candidatus Omnitrophica bacterium]|nr:N-acetylneuraminate synthase [Candidatus Omnitrophota bacterium]
MLKTSERPSEVIEIAGRKVGHDEPCFIVAEAGVNHNGDIRQAFRLVDAAQAAGADAIKFQTFRSEKVISVHAPKAGYQRETTGSSESQLNMAQRLELSFDAFREIAAHARKKGILFMSTPFDEDSADFLDELGMPVFKIPSGEITHLPFLEIVARKGRPVILSTGMSTLDEVETAVRTIFQTGNRRLILLHCVSAYPAPHQEVNLRVMHSMRSVFAVPVGFSDHTQGIEVALAAVALGACVIEKHFTLDRTMPGPDHRASLAPDELRALVTSIRNVESALGDGNKRPRASEMDVRAVARRSIVAARVLRAGTRLAERDLTLKRPGTGLASKDMPSVIGRVTRRALAKDELLDWSALSDE